mgnify:CR=1 FL=1
MAVLMTVAKPIPHATWYVGNTVVRSTVVSGRRATMIYTVAILLAVLVLLLVLIPLLTVWETGWSLYTMVSLSLLLLHHHMGC